MAAAMVVIGAVLFVLAWIFNPRNGLLVVLFHRFLTEKEAPAEPASAPAKPSPI
jgi:hypothetical protein